MPQDPAPDGSSPLQEAINLAEIAISFVFAMWLCCYFGLHLKTAPKCPLRLSFQFFFSLGSPIFIVIKCLVSLIKPSEDPAFFKNGSDVFFEMALLVYLSNWVFFAINLVSINNKINYIFALVNLAIFLVFLALLVSSLYFPSVKLYSSLILRALQILLVVSYFSLALGFLLISIKILRLLYSNYYMHYLDYKKSILFASSTQIIVLFIRGFIQLLLYIPKLSSMILEISTLILLSVFPLAVSTCVSINVINAHEKKINSPLLSSDSEDSAHPFASPIELMAQDPKF